MDSEGRDYFYLQRAHNCCKLDPGDGAALTSVGSPWNWSDVLANQTTEEKIAIAFHATVL